ncbi:MAG TPA: hypothetical protein VH866_06755 [Candidatus Deferrimicrobiaceae bacterium]
MSVLHGGFDEWLELGLPTAPKGSEWKAGEGSALPLDAARGAGL